MHYGNRPRRKGPPVGTYRLTLGRAAWVRERGDWVQVVLEPADIQAGRFVRMGKFQSVRLGLWNGAKIGTFKVGRKTVAQFWGDLTKLEHPLGAAARGPVVETLEVARPRQVGHADPAFWFGELVDHLETVRAGLWIGKVERNRRRVRPGYYVVTGSSGVISRKFGPYKTLEAARRSGARRA